MSVALDPWIALATRVAACSPDDLRRWQRQLRYQIELSEAAKRRHALAHLAGWDGRVGRPLLGLIRLELLRREGIAPG